MQHIPRGGVATSSSSSPVTFVVEKTAEAHGSHQFLDNDNICDMRVSISRHCQQPQ